MFSFGHCRNYLSPPSGQLVHLFRPSKMNMYSVFFNSGKGLPPPSFGQCLKENIFLWEVFPKFPARGFDSYAIHMPIAHRHFRGRQIMPNFTRNFAPAGWVAREPLFPPDLFNQSQVASSWTLTLTSASRSSLLPAAVRGRASLCHWSFGHCCCYSDHQ